MDKVVSTSNGGLSLDISLPSCPLSTNQERIKPQASERVYAIMPSAQTSTNKKDGKCPCSPSPHPEADDNSGVLEVNGHVLVFPTLLLRLSLFGPQLLFPTLRYAGHCSLFLALTVFIPDILGT